MSKNKQQKCTAFLFAEKSVAQISLWNAMRPVFFNRNLALNAKIPSGSSDISIFF